MESNNPDTHTQQTDSLSARYGGLKPKQALLAKDHKYFDSADWALAKEAHLLDQSADVTKLPPPPCPRPPTIHRLSKLEHMHHS